MQLSILSFLAKRPALDTSSVESVQNIPCLASPLPEEQCLALLLPKNLGESVGYFPIKPLVVMRWYFMRASACYPDLRFIDESLAKECMTVGEAFFKEILAKFSDEEKSILWKCTVIGEVHSICSGYYPCNGKSGQSRHKEGPDVSRRRKALHMDQRNDETRDCMHDSAADTHERGQCE